MQDERVDRIAAEGRRGLRVQLVHPTFVENAAESLMRQPGPRGLFVVVAQFLPPHIHYPNVPILGEMMSLTEQEAWDLARANTRAALAPRKGVVKLYGPLRATFFDNDVPGFTASRLLWPELLGEVPGPGAGAFACCYDRDLLVVVRGPSREDAAALHLLWQIRVSRQGYPNALLPDTPLALTPTGKLIPVEFKPPHSGLLVPLR